MIRGPRAQWHPYPHPSNPLVRVRDFPTAPSTIPLLPRPCPPFWGPQVLRTTGHGQSTWGDLWGLGKPSAPREASLSWWPVGESVPAAGNRPRAVDRREIAWPLTPDDAQGHLNETEQLLALTPFLGSLVPKWVLSIRGLLRPQTLPLTIQLEPC